MCVIAKPAWALPDLTEPQLIQLQAGSEDFTPVLDRPGFYALLDAADRWAKNDQRGAVVPDYDAMFEEPDQHRGQLTLIEGQFARAMPIERLSIPGWADRLKQYAILVDENPDQIVLVYVLDPPTKEPASSAPTRLVGRFYKVWQSRDQQNEVTDYLVFVGRATDHQASASSARPASSPTATVLGVLVVLGLCLLIFVRRVSRMSLQPRPLKGRSRKDDRTDGDQSTTPQANRGESADDAADLPDDPIAALDVLRSRKDAEGHDAGNATEQAPSASPSPAQRADPTQ